MGARRKRIDEWEVADKIHSAAIHVLRTVRKRDTQSGLSGARLSLLSVLAFRPSAAIGELAEAEQVSLPSISRMVTALEQDGLVERDRGGRDQRVVTIRATPKGKELLFEARKRRIQDLAERLRELPEEELVKLREAAEILGRISRP